MLLSLPLLSSFCRSLAVAVKVLNSGVWCVWSGNVGIKPLSLDVATVLKLFDDIDVAMSSGDHDVLVIVM